jgi:hypothetical protein
VGHNNSYADIALFTVTKLPRDGCPAPVLDALLRFYIRLCGNTLFKVISSAIQVKDSVDLEVEAQTPSLIPQVTPMILIQTNLYQNFSTEELIVLLVVISISTSLFAIGRH